MCVCVQGFIFVHNDCSEPVRFAVRYKNVSGFWRTKCFWRLAPGEAGHLAHSDLGGNFLQTKNDVIYFWARGPNWTWWGPHEHKCGGEWLNMIQANTIIDSDGDVSMRLICRSTERRLRTAGDDLEVQVLPGDKFKPADVSTILESED